MALEEVIDIGDFEIVFFRQIVFGIVNDFKKIKSFFYISQSQNGIEKFWKNQVSSNKNQILRKIQFFLHILIVLDVLNDFKRIQFLDIVFVRKLQTNFEKNHFSSKNPFSRKIQFFLQFLILFEIVNDLKNPNFWNKASLVSYSQI